MKEDGTVLHHQSAAAHHHIEVFDPSGWALFEWQIPIVDSMSRFELSIQNTRLKNATLRIDELLLSPTGSSIYGLFGESLWYNNRHYPPEILR